MWNSSALESNFCLSSLSPLSSSPSFSALSTLQKVMTDWMTPQRSLKQWPGSALHHGPGAGGTRDQPKSFELGPSLLWAGTTSGSGCRSTKPQEHKLLQSLHAAVRGTQGKSVLPGKGLFIFPVMQGDVVGNRQTLLCQ